MEPSCTMSKTERYGRMAIGAAFVVTGFVIRRDVFPAVTLVTVGSAVTAAAALGR